MTPLDSTKQPTYRILVSGHIPDEWGTWFNGLSVRTSLDPKLGALTLLQGPIPDQARLRGVLNRLWDLNVTLCAVYRTDQEDML